MGFLDKKERVLDIVLTDKGRDLMSQHQLNIQYYAFSDAGINYSGSLANAAVSGNTMDGDVYKTPLFEADRMERKKKDLQSFLYTVPERSPVLPDIRVGADLSSSVTLERRYHYETLNLNVVPSVLLSNPIDVIIRATIKQEDNAFRTFKFVKSQYLKKILKATETSGSIKDLIGTPVGRHYVLVAGKKVLDKRSGKVIPLDDIDDDESVIEIKKEIEKIDGLTNVSLDLSLVGSKPMPAKDGFLIEVYESGSDGTLTRVYQTDLVDPFTNDVVREGFESSMHLKVK